MTSPQYVVEAEDGEVYETNPETGSPWTRAEAVARKGWAAAHGVTVYVYQQSKISAKQEEQEA